MKKWISILVLAFLGSVVYAQENMFTLSGGYSFANIEDQNTNSTGFRINGLYEFNPSEGKIAHGLSVGYIGTSADVSGVGNTNSNYKINSWPIYYAPKFLFGSESAKGFVKGALGMQFSGLKKTGGLLGGEISDTDSGFYGGASIGFIKIFNEKFFINVEYEWAYMSNSFYKDGFMNSVMGGIGVKF